MENKMKSIEKKDRTTDLIQALLDVWEKSVRATHLFIAETDEQGNPYPLLCMQRKNG